jgi:hypothetical protein
MAPVRQSQAAIVPAGRLAGPDGPTLFILTMGEDFLDNLHRLTTGPRTGHVLTATVTVPSAGWPNHR